MTSSWSRIILQESEGYIIPITEELHHPVPIPVEDHGVPVPPDGGGGVAVHDAGDDGLLVQTTVNNTLVHRYLGLV